MTRRRMSLPAQLAAKAATTHGTLTVTDLQAGGVDRSARTRLVEARVLQRARLGIYVVTTRRDPLTPLAALQRAYPEIVVERRTAARVWHLDGFDKAPLVEFAVRPGTRFQAARPPRARRRKGLDRTEFDGIAVTPVLQTIETLATSVGSDLLELAVESALRLGLATPEELDEFRPHCDPTTPPTGSYAETIFLQRVVRPLGLDEPARQVPIRVHGSAKTYVRDFVFKGVGWELDVEIDGLAVHGTPDAHEHDLIRDEEIRAQGCEVLRLTAPRILHRPSSACRALREAIEGLTSKAGPLLPAVPGA